MQSRKQIVFGMLVFAVACAWILLAPLSVAGATTDGASPVVVHEIHEIPAAMREIVDPANGDRWLLLRDSAAPGGPGRLVRVPKAAGSSYALNRGATGSDSVPRPVIHGGDVLVIEQNSPVLEARFRAVALETAQAGARFRARLQATGAIVHAIAIASGRAALAEETGGLR